MLQGDESNYDSQSKYTTSSLDVVILAREIVGDQESNDSNDQDHLELAHDAWVLLKGVNLSLDGLHIRNESMKLELGIILDMLRIQIFIFIQIFEVSRR